MIFSTFIYAACTCDGLTGVALNACENTCQNLAIQNSLTGQSCITNCNTMDRSQWDSCYQKCTNGFSSGLTTNYSGGTAVVQSPTGKPNSIPPQFLDNSNVTDPKPNQIKSSSSSTLEFTVSMAFIAQITF